MGGVTPALAWYQWASIADHGRSPEWWPGWPGARAAPASSAAGAGSAAASAGTWPLGTPGRRALSNRLHVLVLTWLPWPSCLPGPGLALISSPCDFRSYSLWAEIQERWWRLKVPLGRLRIAPQLQTCSLPPQPLNQLISKPHFSSVLGQIA